MSTVGLMQVVAEEFHLQSTKTTQPPIRRLALTFISLYLLPKGQYTQRAPYSAFFWMEPQQAPTILRLHSSTPALNFSVLPSDNKR
jgi:hypothetical protein